MDSQLQDLDGGLNDLLVDANTRIITHKIEKVRGYNDAMSEYVGEMRRCLEGRNCVRAWDSYMAKSLTASLPLDVEQEAIAPPEDKRGRFAELAEMLTSRE